MVFAVGLVWFGTLGFCTQVMQELHTHLDCLYRCVSKPHKLDLIHLMTSYTTTLFRSSIRQHKTNYKCK